MPVRVLRLLLAACCVAGAAATYCRAADSSLGLTTYGSGIYYVTTEVQFSTVCNQCDSIDYFIVHECDDCSQDTMRSCSVKIVGPPPPAGAPAPTPIVDGIPTRPPDPNRRLKIRGFRNPDGLRRQRRR